ncbi:MAG: phosphotransferase family protein [Actinomycetota bacterium]
MSDQSLDALREGLRSVTASSKVENLSRLSGGASRETWRFEADGRPLILQRQRSGDIRDMGVEARVLRAAFAAGVRVPELLHSGTGADAGNPIGSSYMILEHVSGETIARKILRDEQFATARSVLVGDLARTLAALHSIDPDTIAGLPSTDQVQQYRETLDGLNSTLGQSHPAFELAFRWLEANRPTDSRRSLVHGDFRLGNVMVGPDGLRAVLDWELAHIGDPMEDLGWLCVRAWRFGSSKPVAGVGDYDELIGAYQGASGLAVDREVVRWWEVLGTLKWGIMCMIQASSHLTGLARSHELAAIGRRVCENEYDLFLALDGRWSGLGGRR